MTSPANTTQIQIDIAEIKGQLCTLNEIKSSLDALTKSMTGFREEYIREHATLDNKTDKAHARIDDLTKELETMKKTQEEIGKLLPFIRVQMYVITGVSIPILLGVVYWIWSLITHTTP